VGEGNRDNGNLGCLANWAGKIESVFDGGSILVITQTGKAFFKPLLCTTLTEITW
jgi:hypothetical protein